MQSDRRFRAVGGARPHYPVLPLAPEAGPSKKNKESRFDTGRRHHGYNR